MLYIKCVELRQLLFNSQLNDKDSIFADLNRILAPYLQISKFLKVEEAAVLEINSDKYLEVVEQFIKRCIDSYFSALSVKVPTESDTVLVMAEKMVDFVNAHSFFKIFDYCRQAGEKFKELDQCVKKINALLERTCNEILTKKRLAVSDIDFLTTALINYQNFSVVGKELAGELQNANVINELSISEQQYLKETARVMRAIGDQLSVCLNSMIAVGESMVKGHHDLLTTLIAEKNAFGKEVAEFNKQINAIAEEDIVQQEKRTALLSLKDEKVLAYKSLVHQIQAVAVKLTEEHLVSRGELKGVAKDIQKLSKILHEVNKTKYLPRERSAYIASVEDDKHLVAANTVRRLKEKFENLNAREPAMATTLPRSSPIQIHRNVEKSIISSPRNTAITEQQFFPSAQPRANQDITPPSSRATSVVKAAEPAAKSPRTFFSPSSTENLVRNNTISGPGPHPALVTELQEVIKRRPSNPVTPRKDN